jgi:hypothetical protein
VRDGAIETGVGYGATGYQAALLPKLLVGFGDGRFYIQAGPSLTIASNNGVWATGEIGGELPFGRWVLTVGAGAGVLVGGSAQICFWGCGAVRQWSWLPETRLSFGRAF